MSARFDAFKSAHPLYAKAFAHLQRDPMLELSARAVFETHGEEKLGVIADEILRFVEAKYPPDYMQRYVERIGELQRLQERFDAAPSQETLCDPTRAVDRDAYNLALLLSILFSNHRFEIVTRLVSFLDSINGPSGTIASIGMGTGYEIKLMARKMRRWAIEGYDSNVASHQTAKDVLAFFGVAGTNVSWGELFPLDVPDPDRQGRYDGIVLCEVLEHLTGPLTALTTCRDYLKASGRMFVTMAINIAQEDHVFWYPDVASCRAQLAQANLHPTYELVTPMTVRPILPEANREDGFRRGNYIAIVQPKT